MSGRFEGKVALVTGGGWITEATAVGIGSSISQELAAEGAKVGVFDIDPANAERTLEAIRTAGGEAFAIAGDVKSDADCGRAVDEVVAKYGKLDVLVNNVAIGNAPAPIEPGTTESYDYVVDTNFRSFMIMSREAARHLPRGGAIINIGSVFGTAEPIPAGYAIGKRAVSLVATPALAVELGPKGIRVNGVTVGYVWNTQTQMTKPGIREGESVEDFRKVRTATLGLIGVEGMPEDIAKATAFLASDDARWITGQDLFVDGGYALLSPFEILFTQDFRGSA